MREKAKITSLILLLILVTNSSICSAANASNDLKSMGNNYEVYSAEFPDAEIVNDYLDLSDADLSVQDESVVLNGTNADTRIQFYKKLNQNKEFKKSVKEQIKEGKELVGILSAEAYVEETYSDVDDKKVCVDSKLLTAKEIKEMNSTDVDTISSFSLTSVGNKIVSYYKLSLNYAVYKVTPSSYAAEYQLYGIAQWTSTGLTPSQYPSAGTDFLGFTWGGSFAQKNQEAYAWYGSVCTNFNIWDMQPDYGVVWGFNEVWYTGAMGQYPVTYDSITADVTLYKNTLTGSGNQTSFACRYIHTYAENIYSATISYPPSFSINPTTNQWSLIAVVNEIPY